jgi:hypothetical protein
VVDDRHRAHAAIAPARRGPEARARGAPRARCRTRRGARHVAELEQKLDAPPERVVLVAPSAMPYGHSVVRSVRRPAGHSERRPRLRGRMEEPGAEARRAARLQSHGWADPILPYAERMAPRPLEGSRLPVEWCRSTAGTHSDGVLDRSACSSAEPRRSRQRRKRNSC